MPLPPAPKTRGDKVQASSDTARNAKPNTKKLIATSASAEALGVKNTPSASTKAALLTPPTSAKPTAAVPPKKAVETSARTPQTAAPAPVAAPVSAAPAASTHAPSAQRPAAHKQPALGRTKPGKATRLFVLDTNVLLHDPTSLFRFEEHDIYLPLIVLEELDAHKKGTTEVARNGRQVSRSLDALVSLNNTDLSTGLRLDATGQKQASGKLLFQTTLLDDGLPKALPQGKADNQILGVVHALQKQFPNREVILVSKDINMRVKARALGMAAEDYQNDKALDDDELLYSGALALPDNFWVKQSKKLESWQAHGDTFYRIHGPAVQSLLINQFVYYESPGEAGLYTIVEELQGHTAVLRTLRDYTSPKNNVWGVNARNREQNFALNLLMNPEIDFVTLTGTAGTGKTLMALAAGLTQVLDERRYSEIIMTRATVSVGEDIGFLPGTEEEKMGPWMGALDDNLEFLSKGSGSGGEWGRAASNDLIKSRIKIKSMNFMRGRTFLNKYVIIDEAQNLTPKQMKTLITRAGPGTKIICMGNLAQIDTPYLTEGSSGLTYAVDRFKGWGHSGHITLARGERSRLADFASDAL
ncbi:PhoH family protein [Lampropedia puyangensis]|uniref:PhoH family protein n=1 Tax=Lampropedia puyangensis TaxID=1330072 RepID=A0A4S8EZB1_9BURK|nr:PhoH family protein [Lampropedia puyangensis]THT99284.1 PhoH family protein [Lampropedia puyangensis]